MTDNNPDSPIQADHTEAGSSVDQSSNDSTENTKTHAYRIRFNGKPGEFFGIVFVNQIFTMLTLGFYSPWAKVRALQYLYGNTQLDNSHFQFLANPWSMLKTRIIAVILFILYITVDFITGMLASAIFLLCYFALAPVLMVFVVSFRLRYSQWRGVNFSFNKDYAGAYRVYLLPLLSLLVMVSSLLLLTVDVTSSIEQGKLVTLFSEALTDANSESTESLNAEPHDTDTLSNTPLSPDTANTNTSNAAFNADALSLWQIVLAAFCICSFLFLLPFFDFINTRFYTSNIRFGQSKFSFHADAKHYYNFYFPWLGLTLGLMLMLFIKFVSIFAETGWVLFLSEFLTLPLIVLGVLYFPFTRAYLGAHRQNTLLNTSRLDSEHRFRSSVRVLPFMGLLCVNTLAIIISFGLLSAWARIRTIHFLTQTIYIYPKGDLDAFVRTQLADSSSLGEEIADVFDLDLGF